MTNNHRWRNSLSRIWHWLIVATLSFSVSGCFPGRSRHDPVRTAVDRSAALADVVKHDLNRIQCMSVAYEQNPQANTTTAPRQVYAAPTEFLHLSLEEVHQLAIERTNLLRELGGQIVGSPKTVASRYDLALQKSNPQFGPQAALSAFDSHYTTQLFYDRNNRAFNNAIAGGGAFELQQNLMTAQTGVSKRSLNGTEWSLQSTSYFDDNNRLGNLFPNTWETIGQAGVRKPLLRGGGVAFNSIAGPNATPGLIYTNGFVIARLNTAISLADFAIALRNHLRQVEETYWRLYTAYHDLEGKRQTRDAAEKNWQIVRARHDARLEQGEADKEAQAHYQFLMFQEQFLESLNGSDRAIGVYESERSLRRLIGLPVTEATLIYPSDIPSVAPIAYQWENLLQVSLHQRQEIRQQLLRIREQELRLTAARNFLLPRLDLIGQYRVRGLGDDLFGSGPRFTSAAQDLASFEHQEWRVGMEMDMPSGFRQGHAAVQHARLQLVREHTVLKEQEQQVSHELSNAVARVAYLHSVILVNEQRVTAAKNRLQAIEIQFETGKSTVNLLFESQEQFFNTERQLHTNLAAYSLALTQVHLAAGSYLEQVGVNIAEGLLFPEIYAADQGDATPSVSHVDTQLNSAAINDKDEHQ